MSSSITKSTCLHTLPRATMTLCTILHQLEIMFLADLAQLVVVCHTTIKVNDHHALSLRHNSLLNFIDVNFKIIPCRLNQYRCKVVLGDRENSSNVSIRRYNYLVTILHDPHLLVCTHNQIKSIEAVGNGNTLISTDILSIISLKLLILIPLKEPT